MLKIEMAETIRDIQARLTQVEVDHWKSFSNLGTWQFWFMFVLFVVPLIVLYFAIDAENIFLIGLYGFNIHAWATYVDVVGVKLGFWQYIHSLIPFMSFSIAVDVSLVPVVLMLIYQKTFRDAKKFYIASFLGSFFLALVWTPGLTSIGILSLSQWVNVWYLTIIKFATVILSKTIVDIFMHVRKVRLQLSKSYRKT